VTALHLVLDLWPDVDQDDDSPWRHDMWDLADHQYGLCRVPWNTAGGDKAGDLVPAWVCCKCGLAEPSKSWLANHHDCGSPYSRCPIPGTDPYTGRWARVDQTAPAAEPSPTTLTA
jgi:hypothetical protein